MNVYKFCFVEGNLFLELTEEELFKFDVRELVCQTHLVKVFKNGRELTFEETVQLFNDTPKPCSIRLVRLPNKQVDIERSYQFIDRYVYLHLQSSK